MESLVVRRFNFTSRPALPFCALAVCAALALDGCGRKGPLEPPPDVSAAQTTGSAPTIGASTSGGSAQTGNPTTVGAANQAATTAALEEAQTRALGNLDNPGLIQSPNTVYEQSAAAKLAAAQKDKPRPINEPAIPPKKEKPFILDPLLK